LSIARRNKLADTRSNDDSQDRAFHPTSPTMSFLQTLYFDPHWGAKLFLGGEGLKATLSLGSPMLKFVSIDKQKGGGIV
jgi:hypothetical protein